MGINIPDTESTNLSIVRALIDAAKDRHTDLVSAVEVLKKQPGLMDSDVALNWESRCVDVRGQVAFKQPKRQGLGDFVAPYAFWHFFRLHVVAQTSQPGEALV